MSLHHPPRPTPHLVVGITGHRPPVLQGDRATPEADRLCYVLGRIAGCGADLAEREAALFDGSAFVPHMISALAEGADQLAAEVALERGYRLQAVLPLPRDDYRTDFSPAGATRFDGLLAQANCVLELPVQAGGREQNYMLAGRATVAHCDLLIALWDGDPARGPGGTAEIVALALRKGIPVVHLPVGDAAPGRILWTGYGDFVDPDDLDALPARDVSDSTLFDIVGAVLGPPADPRARADLGTFLGERERRVRVRAEYPLMLALLGVKRLRRSAFKTSAYEPATRNEWQSFHHACGGGRHGVSLGMDGFESAFAWSDQLAQYFAQTYRSGNVLNFCLAALAVLIALAGLLFPGLHFWLGLGEPVAIATFVINTMIGTRRQWHRRWLEYRQLAERLRPMRSLKLLGVAAAPTLPRKGGRRDAGWVEWYARAQWRASGCPSGRTHDVAALFKAVLAEEVEPQILYHRASAREMHHLDHRLHILGMILFVVSILSCAASVVASIVASGVAHEHLPMFVALSAGLPAIGGAIFGIRMQGDFGGTAERSVITADELGRIVRALDAPDIGLARQADLVEAATTTMLAELGDWRRIYERRKLELPG